MINHVTSHYENMERSVKYLHQMSYKEERLSERCNYLFIERRKFIL